MVHNQVVSWISSILIFHHPPTKLHCLIEIIPLHSVLPSIFLSQCEIMGKWVEVKRAEPRDSR
jgi:hypothetical protein